MSSHSGGDDDDDDDDKDNTDAKTPEPDAQEDADATEATMTKYVSATYSAAFEAADAQTAAYLAMLDRMRALAAHGPDASAPQNQQPRLLSELRSACPYLSQYGVALVPLCHAIGDLALARRSARAVCVRPRAMLLFAGYDNDDRSRDAGGSGGDPAASVFDGTSAVIGDVRDPEEVFAAEIAVRTRRVTMGGAWAMTMFASDRVVDEALLALSAALQRCVVASLCHWYTMEASTGMAHDVVSPELASTAAASGALPMPDAADITATTAQAAVPMRPREAALAAQAARMRMRVEDLAALEHEGLGIVAVLAHILRCDTLTDASVAAASAAAAASLGGVDPLAAVAGAGARRAAPQQQAAVAPPSAGDDIAAELLSAPPPLVSATATTDAPARPSRQSLKATVLALMLYATQLIPAARALCDLHRTCGVMWLGRNAHKCALRATMDGDDVARTVVALRATRRHWLEAAHGCIQLHAQAARPDAPVPLRAIYTSLATWADSCRRVHFRAASLFFAVYCDWSAVVWARACALADNPDPGASMGALYMPMTAAMGAAAAAAATPVGEVAAADAEIAAESADASIRAALCAGAAGGGGPDAPLPWFPDGVALEKHATDPLMVYAFMRRFRLQEEGGRTAAILYPHPTTIYNWHMPHCYYALVREPRVETRPITALMNTPVASEGICAAVARAPVLSFRSDPA